MTRVLHVILSVDDAAGGPATLLADVLAVSRELDVDSVVLGVQDRPSAVADAMRAHARLVTSGHGRLLGRAHTHARLLARSVRETARADVVVAHSFFNLPGIVAAVAARVLRRPFVVAPHGCLDPYDVRKHERAKHLLAPLWRFVLQRATAWCITDREAAELVTFGAAPRRVVVPPPVAVPDTGATGAAAVPEAVEAVRRGGAVVSFVGRFAHKKGLPRLVEAFDAAAGDDDVLVLAGTCDTAYDGQQAELDRALATIGRRDQVVLPGWIDAGTRAALWSLPGIFALPSDDENFGMAVAEAMASGVPVVVSDRVALADLVAATQAGIVTTTDPGDVAAALRLLLEDPDRRREAGGRGRSAVQDHFSRTAVRRAFGELLTVAATRA